MSEQEFKRALGYANSALDLLERAMIPPYPQFYELLYTYATGVNPTLNSRLNALFRDPEAISGLSERLYNEFIRTQDSPGERIGTLSDRMSLRIESVHNAIDSAMSTANSYSDSLEAAGHDLGGDLGLDAMRDIARKLLGETARMQEANRRLEENLDASREDIAALQRDLDDVRRESMLDPLTKIYNRKSFDEGLLKSLASAEETGDPLSLVLADIDHFKNFNDTWGHQTGDQVLRLVAMTIKSNIKGQDLAARYGGEEFAAVLPSTDLKGAVILADNIRKAIQAKELLKRSTNEKLGRMTASFGVAMYRPGDTPATLIERADRCLYAAKHAGRNRVFGENELADHDAAQQTVVAA